MSPSQESIHEFAARHENSLKTPYYLIDEAPLLANLQRIALLRNLSGAKFVLALKCFSTPAVFKLMSEYLDGTTSSSPFEAKLGHEQFGKEVHAYSVAFSSEDLKVVAPFASKIIFNSVSQLERFYTTVQGKPLGLRVNPGVSFSGYDLADPARQYSRLGVSDEREVERVADQITGLMFHCNCENASLERLSRMMEQIEAKFEHVLRRMQWVSLGGGIAFTHATYPLEALGQRLKDFANRFKVQVYLEPGEAVITRTGYLVTRVLDVVKNGMDIAIVDAGVETHMLDYLVYNMEAKIDAAAREGHRCIVAGRTCLAGDIFGTYNFREKPNIGDFIAFADASGYSMVKKNWFNGIAMPSIVVRRLNGTVDVVKEFRYEDFLHQLS